MNLEELEQRFRLETGDKTKPYLFAAADVRRWLNEAQEDAVRRADLLLEADDADLCEIPIPAGEPSFPLDPRWVRITRGAWQQGDCDQVKPLELVLDRRVLDRRYSDWRTRRCDPREVLIEAGRGRVSFVPEVAGTLLLEGFRLPKPMTTSQNEPEILAVHHVYLVQGAMARAYMVPDSDMHDPQRAKAAEDAFTRWFGPARDAQMGQDFEVAPFNVAQW